MVNEKTRSRSIKSLENADKILRALQDSGGSGVTDLSKRLNLSKATVHNHLKTLKSLEYVVQDEDVYKPSLLFLYFGKRNQLDNSLYQEAKETIDEISEECGEYVHLVIEEHGKAVYLYRTMGDRAIGSRTPLGQRDLLHHSAAGKAILAHLPEERIDEIVEQHGLKRMTENTITDRDKLDEELERIRERGYSLNLGEEIDGLRAVGAPILEKNGRLIGSISISGPTSRMEDDILENKYANLVQNGANIIELKMTTQE